MYRTGMTTITEEMPGHIEDLGSRTENKRTLAADWLNDAWVNGTDEERVSLAAAVRKRALEVGQKRGAGRALVRTLQRPDGFAIEAMAVLSCAKTCDSMVRDSAESALGEMGTRWSRVYKWLLGLIDHDDPVVRGGAGNGLMSAAHKGADLTTAIDRLVVLSQDEALPSGAAWRVGFGIAVFASRDPHAETSHERLASLLNEGSVEAIRGAVNQLARFPSPVVAAGRAPLTQLVKHKRKPIREDAMVALACALVLLDDGPGFAELLKRKSTKKSALWGLKCAAKAFPHRSWMDDHLTPPA